MLHQIEARILEALDGRMSAGELSEKAGIPLGSILSFAQSLREKGFVSIESEEKKGFSLTAEARGFLERGLPEQQVFSKACQSARVSSLSQAEKEVGLPWAMRNGWVKIELGILRKAGEMQEPYPLHSALAKVASGQPESVPDADLAMLAKRKLILPQVSKSIHIQPTAVRPPVP